MTTQDIAPLCLIGWGILLTYYGIWRIGHDKRMAEYRRQIEEANRITAALQQRGKDQPHG